MKRHNLKKTMRSTYQPLTDTSFSVFFSCNVVVAVFAVDCRRYGSLSNKPQMQRRINAPCSSAFIALPPSQLSRSPSSCTRSHSTAHRRQGYTAAQSQSRRPLRSWCSPDGTARGQIEYLHQHTDAALGKASLIPTSPWASLHTSLQIPPSFRCLPHRVGRAVYQHSHFLPPNPIFTICIFIPLSPTFARNRKKPLTDGSRRSL